MGRVRRLHVSGGIYYLHLRANSGQKILENEEDVAAFKELVAAALARCNAQLYAFSWTSEDARLAVQISDVPLGDVAHLIAAPYSRRVHKMLGRRGNLFTRYHAVLIASESYVLRLVRYIHLVPAMEGHSVDPSWSSHGVYLGEMSTPWVNIAPVMRIFARHRGKGRDTYRKYMQEGTSATDKARFEGTSSYVPTAGVSADVLETQSRDRAALQSSAPLDALVDAVARTLRVLPTEICSRSRRRHVALARALVAWHATRNGIATLSNVARYFDRHPSSLSEGLQRHTREHSELFNQSLTELVEGAAKRQSAKGV